MLYKSILIFDCYIYNYINIYIFFFLIYKDYFYKIKLKKNFFAIILILTIVLNKN